MDASVKAVLKTINYGFVLFLMSIQNLSGQQGLQTFSVDVNASTPSLNVLAIKETGLKLCYSLKEFHVLATRVSGETMQTILIDEAFLPNDEGYPNLPGISRMVAIPQYAQAVLKIKEINTETFFNIEVAPAPRIPKDNEPDMPEPVKNEQVYRTNALYPASPVLLSEPMNIRGVDVVMVGITPFQYNPVTKELVVYKNIDFTIEFVGGNGQFGDNRLRSRWWDPLLDDMLANREVLPRVDYKIKENRSEDADFEYVIIAPDDPVFLQWADSIRMFRIKQGIRTGVFTTTQIGGNSVSAIEGFVNNAYNNWDIPPSAVLLLGDYGTSGNTIISPVYDNYCASDNIFADVNGDHLPDIIFARMTAQTPAHLETMVTKFLNYERTPPTNPGFYNKPITAMGWQTDRWFQMCSEIVNGFFEHVQGKSPVRENAVYSGSPSEGVWSTAQNTQTIINYFGESGLQYIPNTPNHLTDWGGNASRINNDINSGAFLLQHRDHGMETGWGEPAYTSGDIFGTTNTDLTFVFSVNCLTGKYNLISECFTETFHRHQYGALGLIAASEVSYSFVNDTYVWGMYDNMWPDFMPAYGTIPETRGILPSFGNAAGKYFLQQSSWPYNTNNKQLTYHLFHHHGDAFSIMYSEVPQHMIIEHDDVIMSDLGFFTVKAPAGSLVSLTLGEDILYVAEGTGQFQGLPVPNITPGSSVRLTITKQNYYRYERDLSVIPPSGPYCVFHSYTINDEIGNGNNVAEYNELVYINLSVKNLGMEAASGVQVNLSTVDEYVEFYQSEAVFNYIEAGKEDTVADVFLIKFKNNFPDNRQVKVQMHATDGTEEWSSYFFISARSPDIRIGNMFVEDPVPGGNNNGQLDPGERALIRVNNFNTGFSTATNSVSKLSLLSRDVLQVNEEYNLNNIGLSEGVVSEFEIVVSPEATNGLMLEAFYEVHSGGYTVTKSFFPKIGLYLEDWETGGFTKFNWQYFGSAPWEISAQNPYQGIYHARSGAITHGQSSIIRLSYKTLMNDSIIFMRKVSSEAEADKLRFFIDNAQVGSWSGISQGWIREGFPVPPGSHSFMWVYEKDGAGSDGADCAWLDNIYLPAPLVTTIFAGKDAITCANGYFSCNPRATNVKTMLWSSTGDGEFSNPAIMYPIYTPGPTDIELGSTDLIFSIVDQSNNSLSDTLTLSFTTSPEIPVTASGAEEVDPWVEEYSWYATNHSALATMYNWTIEPEQAGTIVGFDTTAVVLWSNSYAGMAYIRVAAVNSCGQSDFSEPFEVFVNNPVAVLPADEQAGLSVFPNPANESVYLKFSAVKADKALIEIVNQSGVVVASRIESVVTGENTIKLDIRGFAPGIYYLRCTTGSFRKGSKFLLVR
jgi:hypothetical protein